MHIANVGIHIKVSNFGRSKSFYEALGFKKVFEYGPDKTHKKDAAGHVVSVPERYRGITFQHGGGKVELGEGHPAVRPEVFAQPIMRSKVSLMVFVDSIKGVIDRCKRAGIPLAVGPRHYYWGTLEVVVKDPDGFVLVFIAPYSETEAKAVGADEAWGKPPRS